MDKLNVIDNLESRASAAIHSNPDGWPEPQSLTVLVQSVPYPLEELPACLRAAVSEVAGFTKAPESLIVSAAMAAMSVSIQAHVNIERTSGLSSPVSLFQLVIADSGERKSSVDGIFMRAIRDFEAEQAELAKPLINDYNADLAAWDSKYLGVKDKIRQLAKENKPTSAHESELKNLGHEKPEPSRFPRLTYSDVTPEKLAINLGTKYPSAGVIAAEGGLVFGSHGMSGDSVTRNLSMLNQLWDGNSLQIDRKTSESFTVDHARLTVSLMVQAATLQDFYGNFNFRCGVKDIMLIIFKKK